MGKNGSKSHHWFFSRTSAQMQIGSRFTALARSAISARLIGPLLSGLLLVSAGAQGEIIDFDDERWDTSNAEVVTYLGEKSLIGRAYLQDAEFENGVLEVDMAVDGSRCFPGIAFRMRSQENFELFYIRPHQPNRAHALQYTPVFNGLTSWQLYSGNGFTAEADMPTARWVHVKLEVSGTQARVYFDSDVPSLVINDLKHGAGSGAVGLVSPPGGQVHFANFSIRYVDELDLGALPRRVPLPDVITSWELSQSFFVSEIDRSLPLGSQDLAAIEWQVVESEPSGLVDIARYIHPKGGTELESVIARTTLHADREELRKLAFGYSDQIAIFLNGELLFTGDSTFRVRDPDFMGIVGFNDAVYLPLEVGSNELVFIVTELFGGWGFTSRLEEVRGEAVFQHRSVAMRWELFEGLRMPEAVVHDPRRNVLYVSNFTGLKEDASISKVTLDGQMAKADWVTGIAAPTGMAMWDDQLFVVERSGLVEIDPESGEVVARHSCPGRGFANDVVFDASGSAYISDSEYDRIYKFSGDFEVWLEGAEIAAPNGLAVVDDRLVVGSGARESLVFVSLEDKRVVDVIEMPPGFIDGIRPDGRGGYIVSHAEGRVYRVARSGQTTTLLDTSASRISAADIEYVARRNLLVVPTLGGNKVTAYEIMR